MFVGSVCKTGAKRYKPCALPVNHRDNISALCVLERTLVGAARPPTALWCPAGSWVYADVHVAVMTWTFRQAPHAGDGVEEEVSGCSPLSTGGMLPVSSGLPTAWAVSSKHHAVHHGVVRRRSNNNREEREEKEKKNVLSSTLTVTLLSILHVLCVS